MNIEQNLRMNILAMVASIFSLIIAGGVLWMNPRRSTNQVFACLCLLQSIWLYCIYNAMHAGDLLTRNTHQLDIWLRTNAAVAAFAPWGIWLLISSITKRSKNKSRTAISTIPWLLLTSLLIILCYSETFVIENSNTLTRGVSYLIYNCVGACAYAISLVYIYKVVHKVNGIRKIELQFLALSITLASGLVLLLNAIGNTFEIRSLNRVSILVIFTASVVMAGSLTFHQVFNARQILLLFVQRLILFLFLGVCALAALHLLQLFCSTHIAAFASVILCTSLGIWLNFRSQYWLGLNGEQLIAKMRQSVIQHSTEEMRTTRLTSAFEQLLKAQYKTSFTLILLNQGRCFSSDTIDLVKDRKGCEKLCEIGWATPESLQRRRQAPGLDDLRGFMEEHSLGLIIAVPRGSPNPALLVAFGVKQNEALFTYPEIQRIQNVAELMDGILSRARLTAQAAMQAKMEHLAMMSRGLAHDLKNLITPVSSFLVHTENQFSPGSVESEVHMAAKHSVGVMAEYLREALFFSERLAPRFEHVDVRRLLETVIDVTRSRSTLHNVNAKIVSNYNDAVVADGILLERMLVNLVNNAIDASRPNQWVEIHVSSGARSGWLRFQVIDQGCGISPENLARVFEPYFTTKQTGNDYRGFGLGLTICEKIIHLHGGTIAMHSQLGAGSTITVDLPFSPPS